MLQQKNLNYQQHTPQYLTEKEVALMTGIALSTLRNNRAMNQGIPYSKIGRSVRYLLEDVERFFESKKINTNDCQSKVLL